MTGDDTEPLQAVEPGRRSRLAALRSRRWRSRTLIVALVTAAAVGVGGYSLAAIQGRADEATENAEDATEQAALSEANAQLIAEQVRAACDEGGELAEQLGDVCQQAEQIAEEPAEPVVIPPTDEQLRPLVEDWLTRNPPVPGRDGRTPTVAEITDIAAGEIARQLAQNPPQDGRTPTPGEIRPIVQGVVADYLLANPPPSGQDGVDGQPGEDGVDGLDGVDGAPGEPPFSWTFTHCGTAGLNCTTYRCSRDPDFDPSAPEYVCEPVAS